MSPRERDLRQQRSKLIDEAGALLRDAQARKVPMDPTAQSRFDECHRTAETLWTEINAIQKQDAEERDLLVRHHEATRTRSERYTAGYDDLPTGALAPERRMVDFVRQTEGGDQDFERKLSIGQLARAMMTGPRSELERRALSEGTDSAGGYTVPSIVSAKWIDRLRPVSVALRAGAQLVPLSSDVTTIAKLLTDPTCAWRSENAQISPSDPTFGAVTFTARSLATLVVASRELLEDSINIESALNSAFTRAMAAELDRAALFGSGSAPEPRGVYNTSNIGSVSMGTNGAALTNYDPFVDVVATLEAANAQKIDAFVMAPRTSAALAKLDGSGDGQPLGMPPKLVGIPHLISSTVPIDQTQGSAIGTSSCVVAGDFSDLYIGVRSAVHIQLLKERFADYVQTGFLVTGRFDVQVARPASFCKLVGIIPAS